MKKRSVGSHLSWTGFATGITAALAGALVQVSAAPTLGVPSGINVVSHGVGCRKYMPGQGGWPVTTTNGIKNVDTDSTLELVCPLTSPLGGFDPANDKGGVDVDDQNNNTEGWVSVKSCYSNRAIAGGGCSTAVQTPETTGNGRYGVEVALQVATDVTAARYLNVVLPPQDGLAASTVRSYGYLDFAASGGGGGTDLTALQAAVTSNNNSISTINGRLDGHDTSIASMSSTLMSQSSTLSGHTSSISGINGTLGSHAADIASLQSEVSQINTQGSDITTLQADVASLQGDQTALWTTVNTHGNQLAGFVGSGLKNDIDALSMDVSTHTSQLANSTPSALKSNIDALSMDVSTHTSQLANGTPSALKSNIDALSMDVSMHTSQLADGTPSALKSNIDALSMDVSTHTSQLANSTASGLKSAIDSQGMTLSSHASTLSSQASTLTTHTNQLANSAASGLKSAIDSQGMTLMTHTNQLANTVASGLKTAFEAQDTAHHKRLGQLEAVTFYRTFITSLAYPGNMGATTGVAGADLNCQNSANAAGLGGTWAAWISGSTGAASRLNSNMATSVRYINLWGEPVGVGKADFTDGMLTNAIRYDENLFDRAGTQAWTGTTIAGVSSGSTCTNWTTVSGASSGTVGDAGSNTATWVQSTTQFCNTMQRLICIEQGT